MKLNEANGSVPKKPVVPKETEVLTTAPTPSPDPTSVTTPLSDDLEDDDDPPFDLDDDGEVTPDFDAMRTEIRNLNKSGTAEQKKAVKAIIASTGKRLDAIDDLETLTKIIEVFN